MRPPLKWAGGKRRLAETFKRCLPDDYHERRHVEPFAGSAALFFEWAPKRALLNDINIGLMSFYDWLQREPDTLIQAAGHHSEEYRKAPAEVYATERAVWNAALLRQGSLDAGRFLFLNKTCFNGLWRENKRGEFNTPHGDRKEFVVDRDNLLEASELLQRAALTDRDFGTIDYQPGDFVYFDPPYVPLKPTSSFTTYSAGGFGLADQTRLADLFRRLSDNGVPAMLSNSYTEPVNRLYKGFFQLRIPVARSISAKASSRKRVDEVLILSASLKKRLFATGAVVAG